MRCSIFETISEALLIRLLLDLCLAALALIQSLSSKSRYLYFFILDKPTGKLPYCHSKNSISSNKPDLPLPYFLVGVRVISSEEGIMRMRGSKWRGISGQGHIKQPNSPAFRLGVLEQIFGLLSSP